MTPSRLAATLRNIAAKIDASKKPSKVLVARELKRVVRSITAAGEISFSGTIKSRFDGENNSAEGTIITDSATHQITVNSSSSGRGADYELDGNLVDWDSAEHETLDNYFTNIWPADEGSWDAEVQNGRVSPVTPVLAAANPYDEKTLSNIIKDALKTAYEDPQSAVTIWSDPDAMMELYLTYDDNLKDFHLDFNPDINDRDIEPVYIAGETQFSIPTASKKAEEMIRTHIEGEE